MNKDIFVWKSYGDVTVYDVSTLEKRISLLELIRKAAYFLDSDCSDCNSVIECIDKVGGVCCHETFEYGTGFTKLK
jgi:hypothetical protein